MKGLGHLVIANGRMFFRVRQEVFWVFLFPLLLLILTASLLGDVAGIGNLSYENINFSVGVVDKDHTSTASKFIKKLQESPELQVVELEDDEAVRQAWKGEQRVILIFPEGFEQALAGSDAIIEIVREKHARPFTEMAISIIKREIEVILTDQSATKPPIIYHENRVETVEGFYDRLVDFLAPGIIALALMPSCIFSLAPMIVRFREQGVMRRLWVTPISKMTFATSHVIFRLFIGVCQTILIILAAMWLFEANLHIHILPMVMLILLGSLTGTAISFAIAAFARTPEVASLVANAVSLPMIFLCGIIMPLDIMPAKILPLIWLLPLTHLSESLRGVMTAQRGILDVWVSGLVLIVYVVGLSFVAILAFKWDKIGNGQGAWFPLIPSAERETGKRSK